MSAVTTGATGVGIAADPLAAEGRVTRNREGEPAYDIHWPWHRPQRPGLTAVLRVRNEAHNLPWVLPPLLEAVPYVVIVDNQSSDGTLETARRIVTELGASERVTLTSYPFVVSRCGPEHLATPADSVHSLTHFYNWSFSHVTTTYAMKWDGDMVLTPEGIAAVRDLSWQLEGEEVMVLFPRLPLYIESDSVGYLDASSRNMEPWIHPVGPQYTFVKGFDWEVWQHPEDMERLVMPLGTFVELKWLDHDEFAHWTDPSAFTDNRSPRKVREYHVHSTLRDGRADDLDHVFRIEAPLGVHIVDHAARVWLPRHARGLPHPARRANGEGEDS